MSSSSSVLIDVDFHISGVLAGIIAVAAGVLLLTFGYRLFRVAIAVVGFIIAYGVCATLFNEHTSLSNVLIILIAVAAGILGSILMFFVWQLGLAFVGAVGMIFLCSFIITVSFDDVQDELDVWVQYVIIMVEAVIGATLVLYLEKPVLIVATSLIGAVVGVYGVAALISEESYMVLVEHAVQLKSIDLEDDTKSIMLYAATVFGFLMGLLIQGLCTARSYNRKEESERAKHPEHQMLLGPTPVPAQKV